GVLELARDLRFFDEAVEHPRLGLVLLEENLQRDVAAEVDVAALPDRADAAARDLTVDFVPRDLPRRNARGVARRRFGLRVLAAQHDVRNGGAAATKSFDEAVRGDGRFRARF